MHWIGSLTVEVRDFCSGSTDPRSKPSLTAFKSMFNYSTLLPPRPPLRAKPWGRAPQLVAAKSSTRRRPRHTQTHLRTPVSLFLVLGAASSSDARSRVQSWRERFRRRRSILADVLRCVPSQRASCRAPLEHEGSRVYACVSVSGVSSAKVG